MKSLIIILLGIFIVTGSLFGQSNYASDTIKYITEEDVAYKLGEESKYMIKLAPIAFEYKLGDAFSLSTLAKSSGVLNDNFLTANFSLGLEGRYYYQMKDRIEAGLQAHNLSGKYIAVTPSVGYGVNIIANTNMIDFGEAYGLSLGWAEQNRIYDYFLWNNGLELSYTRFDKNFIGENFSVLTLFRKSEFGIAFSRGSNSKQDKTQVEPEVKVNVNEKYALRIIDNNNYSISRITRGDLSEPFWQLLAIPNMISEVKVANSPFSIVHDLRARIELSNYQNGVRTEFKANRILYSLKMGTRYYYKMKSNVLTGKQGNNFSGGYIVANLAYHNTINKGSDLTFLTGGWGYQREVGKKFFINIDLTLAAIVNGDRPQSDLVGTPYLNAGRFTINIGRRIF